MRVRTLLPDDRALKLIGVEFDHENGSVTMQVRSALQTTACPVCGRYSRRVHSRYDRERYNTGVSSGEASVLI
jgi:hypothetical protein